MKNKKMKILVGVQPTGRLHIGNYLGCLKKALELQKEGHEVTFLIAQYHAETSGEVCWGMGKELARLGAKNIQYQQEINTHVFWKLLCKTKMPELERMTQYKDKKEKSPNVGLFTYPVLMAADIMVHCPDYVLVGEDQLQHLELANTLAKRVGRTKPIEYMLSETPRIMSLVEPSKKMSKSLGDKHVLYLFDEDYETKLKKAITTQEGIKNLRLIGDSLNIPRTEKFSIYKQAIAEKMKLLFSI